MSSLQEHLEATFDVDVEQEIGLREAHVSLEDEPARVRIEAQRFVIDDEQKATWALRKLVRVRAELQEKTNDAQAEIARINEWMDREAERLERQESFFLSLLEEFHRTRLAQDPKAKTISLPAGSLKARKAPDNVDFDAEAFVEWAQVTRPEFIRMKLEVDRAKVKEAVLKDGEILPGVEKVEGDLRFSVETS